MKRNINIDLLKEKHTLAKIRVELEERKRKLCQSCKGFGYLACNCRNGKGERKEELAPQNKFEVLRSRVMQCEIEEKVIRRQEEARGVECFKYGGEGHKCRECPLWKEMKRKRVEEKAVRVVMPQKAQQKEWRRTLVHVLQQKAQEQYGVGIPNEACLLELEWYMEEVVVLYLVCEECGEQGCHVEENRRQGVISRKRLKELK